MNGLSRRITLYVTAGVVALLVAAASWTLLPRTAPMTVPYSSVLARLDAGSIDSLLIVPGRHVIAFAGGRSLLAAYTATDINPLVQQAVAAGATVTFAGGTSPLTTYVTFGLGLVLIFAVGLAIRQHLGGKGPGANLAERGRSDSTFGDVAGNGGAVSELREVVAFLQSPDRFDRLGARTPRGVLLYGPPGTGKTLMARAVAGEAGVPFWTMSGSEVTGFIVGLGAMRIKGLFKKARKRGGVIFIDELDALGGKRGRNQAHNEDDRTLNQLLVEMDGFATAHNVVVIAATNRPEDLDPALRRPGRFDRSIAVGLPTSGERRDILQLHARNRRVPLDGNVDLERLARLMPQTSGAELANLINEAAIVAARDDAGAVGWTHFEAARDRLLLGKERRGFQASAGEWTTVAMHEAGHALLGVLFVPEDDLHKVTIQPRGDAMGVAFFSPDSDRHLHSKRYLEGQILKGLGGRAAEEALYGDDAVTSGARSDLQHVTRIAREMVYHLGMGTTAGLMVFDREAPPSEEARTVMDREVRETIDRLYRKALVAVREHRAALEALGHALLEHETLDGPDALQLLAAHGVPVGEAAAA